MALHAPSTDIAPRLLSEQHSCQQLTDSWTDKKRRIQRIKNQTTKFIRHKGHLTLSTTAQSLSSPFYVQTSNGQTSIILNCHGYRQVWKGDDGAAELTAAVSHWQVCHTSCCTDRSGGPKTRSSISYTGAKQLPLFYRWVLSVKATCGLLESAAVAKMTVNKCMFGRVCVCVAMCSSHLVAMLHWYINTEFKWITERLHCLYLKCVKQLFLHLLNWKTYYIAPFIQNDWMNYEI